MKDEDLKKYEEWCKSKGLNPFDENSIKAFNAQNGNEFEEAKKDYEYTKSLLLSVVERLYGKEVAEKVGGFDKLNKIIGDYATLAIVSAGAFATSIIQRIDKGETSKQEEYQSKCTTVALNASKYAKLLESFRGE